MDWRKGTPRCHGSSIVSLWKWFKVAAQTTHGISCLKSFERLVRKAWTCQFNSSLSAPCLVPLRTSARSSTTSHSGIREGTSFEEQNPAGNANICQHTEHMCSPGSDRTYIISKGMQCDQHISKCRSSGQQHTSQEKKLMICGILSKPCWVSLWFIHGFLLLPKSMDRDSAAWGLFSLHHGCARLANCTAQHVIGLHAEPGEHVEALKPATQATQGQSSGSPTHDQHDPSKCDRKAVLCWLFRHSRQQRLWVPGKCQVDQGTHAVRY